MLLTPLERAGLELVQRFARKHGPFVTQALTERYGLPATTLENIQGELEREGSLVRGELHAKDTAADWCEVEVLRRLKRRTLAKLRQEIAPVDAATLAMFLPQWHGINTQGRGSERLLEVIGQLEGLFLPWSILSGVLLAQRIAGFSLDMLDQLAAFGVTVWIGAGALGAQDGRVAIFRHEQVRRLLMVDQSYVPRPAPTRVFLLICENTVHRSPLRSKTLSARFTATLIPLLLMPRSGIWCGLARSPTIPLGLCVTSETVRIMSYRAGASVHNFPLADVGFWSNS